MNQEPIDTNPFKAILWGVAFFLFFVFILMLTSCATLESIPFSVSYQDQSGNTYTVHKQAVIRATK